MPWCLADRYGHPIRSSTPPARDHSAARALDNGARYPHLYGEHGDVVGVRGYPESAPVMHVRRIASLSTRSSRPRAFARARSMAWPPGAAMTPSPTAARRCGWSRPYNHGSTAVGLSVAAAYRV